MSSSGLKKVNSNLKGRPSTLWTMSVGCPGNGRQPLEEPYTVQWVRWPISYGDQPLTGEPDAGEPPVRFGGRGDSSIVPTPNPPSEGSNLQSSDTYKIRFRSPNSCQR